MPTHSRRAFQPAFADEGNAGWPAADRIAPSPGDIKKKCHNRLPIGGTAPTHSRRVLQPAFADVGNTGWPAFAVGRIAPTPGYIKKKCHNRLPIGGTTPTHSRRVFQPASPIREGLGDRFILQLNEREIQYKTYKALYKRKNLVSYTFARMRRAFVDAKSVGWTFSIATISACNPIECKGKIAY